MASIRLSSERFVVGETVTAYLQSNWLRHELPPSGGPKGSSAGSAAVAADGSVTITGLTKGADYFAYAATPDRYVRFTAGADNSPQREAVLTLDRDNGQAGMIAPSGLGWSPSPQAMAANVARLARFVPSRDMRIGSIAFAVTVAAGADDACDVGIYDSAMARLVSKGATTGLLNSTGVKTVTITPTTLKAGQVYYVAISNGALGGTAASVMGASYASANAARLFGTANGKWEVDQAAAAHPLPNPITPAANSGVGFMVALLEA